MTTVEDDELFELIRRNYAEANKEYIQEQIRIASEYLTEEQKAELRQKVVLTQKEGLYINGGGRK